MQGRVGLHLVVSHVDVEMCMELLFAVKDFVKYWKAEKMKVKKRLLMLTLPERKKNKCG